MADMEYDKATVPNSAQGPQPASSKHDEAPIESGEGHLRVYSDAVDTKRLGEPVTFPFSGRTAPNRFLKAPMTERLCTWNKDGEDIVRSVFSLEL